MQHTKFYSFTAHEKNNNFTYQANNRLLQNPLSTVVVLCQYHKNFSSSNRSAHQHSAEKGSIASRSLAFWKKLKNLHTFTQSSSLQIKKKKAMLIRSRDWSTVKKFFKLHRKSEQRRIINNKTSFRQQNKDSITTGAETKSSSENRRKILTTILHQSYA